MSSGAPNEVAGRCVVKHEYHPPPWQKGHLRVEVGQVVFRLDAGDAKPHGSGRYVNVAHIDGSGEGRVPLAFLSSTNTVSLRRA